MRIADPGFPIARIEQKCSRKYWTTNDDFHSENQKSEFVLSRELKKDALRSSILRPSRVIQPAETISSCSANTSTFDKKDYSYKEKIFSK